MTDSVDPSAGESTDPTGGVQLRAIGGRVEVLGGDGDAEPAELIWADTRVRVLVDGLPIDGTSCRVSAAHTVEIDLEDTPAAIRYVADVASDAMEASLSVVPEPGVRRTLLDAEPATTLALAFDEAPIDPPPPSAEDAAAELERAGVVHGLLAEQVAAAVAAPGAVVVAARGVAPVDGIDGSLEHLVEFEALRLVGIPAGTQLVRRVPRQEGTPGIDVTGAEVRPAPTTDAALRAGEGAQLDADGNLATAAIDGSPRIDAQGRVEVHHEVTIDEVDKVSGDISFIGSVRVTGSVHEGRTLVAHGDVVIEGGVDRGHVDSGGNLEVHGTIMSSVLRAGAERAVAASIADRALGLPASLALVAGQSRQLREQAAAREQAMLFGLSVQVVLERLHKPTMQAITSIADELATAGEAHLRTAAQTRGWQRALAAAANHAMTEEQFAAIQAEVTALADDVKRALENPADMLVAYMQASEAEATGTITVTGRGIYSSRVVAVGGLDAQRFEAVLRGGSVTSNGRVHVAEVGSPAGARTDVRLGLGASLEADRAYAGTVVSGPGYNHRFEADRTHVRIGFDAQGQMHVESLAS